MKFVGRHAVEGTAPMIYIVHGPYRDRRTGKVCITKTWYAEYCIEAQRHYEPFGTTNKAAAVKQAPAIVQRIEGGSTSNTHLD